MAKASHAPHVHVNNLLHHDVLTMSKTMTSDHDSNCVLPPPGPRDLRAYMLACANVCVGVDGISKSCYTYYDHELYDECPTKDNIVN